MFVYCFDRVFVTSDKAVIITEKLQSEILERTSFKLTVVSITLCFIIRNENIFNTRRS